MCTSRIRRLAVPTSHFILSSTWSSYSSFCLVCHLLNLVVHDSSFPSNCFLHCCLYCLTFHSAYIQILFVSSFCSLSGRMQPLTFRRKFIQLPVSSTYLYERWSSFHNRTIIQALSLFCRILTWNPLQSYSPALSKLQLYWILTTSYTLKYK